MNTKSSLDRALLEAEIITAVKHLQHRFGYALEAHDWTSATELFADDAYLQVGHHSARVGRRAIENHLPQAYADDLILSANSASLPGFPTPATTVEAVRAHLQIMPVITVDLDSATVHGTWRHLGFGGSATAGGYWTEGPQEVTYRWEADGWKISSLRWFRTFVVPHDGGWSGNADASSPEHDRGWPLIKPTPFHFLTTPSTPQASDAAEPSETTGVRSGGLPLPPTIDAERERRLQNLEVVRAIENLQNMLGYYFDKGQWTSVAALFTEQARCTYQQCTIANGYADILLLLRSIGPAGPAPGRLLDLIHIQPIVTATSANMASAQWKVFAQLGLSRQSHEWGLIDFTAHYKCTPAGWRISELNLEEAWFSDYHLGWGRDRRNWSRIFPQVITESLASELCPPPDSADSTAPIVVPVSSNSASTEATENDLPQRAHHILSALRVERLQYQYGYYLAEFRWDELTELFTDSGSIEIALRGVYQGHQSIRSSLELYGSGLEHGVLHNHMQFQPVIHLDENGHTARIRSRALSMMGNHGGASMWMGGVYENTMRYQNGRWLMHLDRVVNTYFTPYDTGWKDLAQRKAPGMSTVIPPDAPPTEDFDMYPGSHLVPYHYPNPGSSTTP